MTERPTSVEGEGESRIAPKNSADVCDECAVISRRLDIVVANGKVVIPRVVQAVERQFPPDSVIVVADSDGRADSTRRMLEKSLGGPDHWLVIAHPNVESWITGRVGRLGPEDLRSVATQADLRSIEARHPEFKLFREALISIPLPR